MRRRNRKRGAGSSAEGIERLLHLLIDALHRILFRIPDGDGLSYSASGVTKAGVASGSSLSTTHGNVGRSGVSFETPVMKEDMELTGPLAMKLWVSSTSEDMDIFVTLRNIGPNNEDVCEVGQHGQPGAQPFFVRADPLSPSAGHRSKHHVSSLARQPTGDRLRPT